MSVLQYVDAHSAVLGESAKLAADLAALLDHSVLSAATIEAQKYDPARLAIQRLEVFEDVCALCAQAGIPVPELEPEILELCRPKAGSDKDTKAIADLVVAARGKLGRKRPKADPRHDILAICRCLERMPGLAPVYDGKLDRFRAVVNAALLELGLPTIRPSYPDRHVRGEMSGMKPTKAVRVVVVDDDVSLIVSTIRELAGWPDLTFVPFHFTIDGDTYGLSAAQRAEVSRKSAADILALNPDIVCMDEGLPGVHGGEVIEAIRTQKGEVWQIAFVGSTGGVGEHLRDAGALLNLEKGRHPGVLAQAVGRF